jgi:hypothetical protein
MMARDSILAPFVWRNDMLDVSVALCAGGGGLGVDSPALRNRGQWGARLPWRALHDKNCRPPRDDGCTARAYDLVLQSIPDYCYRPRIKEPCFFTQVAPRRPRLAMPETQRTPPR